MNPLLLFFVCFVLFFAGVVGGGEGGLVFVLVVLFCFVSFLFVFVYFFCFFLSYLFV